MEDIQQSSEPRETVRYNLSNVLRKFHFKMFHYRLLQQFWILNEM